MERDIAKFSVLSIAALVVADMLTHGSVTTTLWNSTTGFLSTLARLIAGQQA